jgi:hypothetical protein
LDKKKNIWIRRKNLDKKKNIWIRRKNVDKKIKFGRKEKFG